jgi:hypothetical protein
LAPTVRHHFSYCIRAGEFRCLVLDSMSENDTSLFTQPLALARLARFIAKAYIANGEWKGKRGLKPLVG